MLFVELFRILFVDFCKKLLQVFIFGDEADWCFNSINITVCTHFKPSEPYFYVFLFAEKFAPFAASCSLGEEVVETCHERLLFERRRVEELELCIHVVA